MIPLIAGLGVPELLVLLLICVLLFGATKLPLIGRGLGEGIRNFKRGLNAPSDPASDDRAGDRDDDTRPSGVDPR
jgi:sec-independent protein translocase protein TatA